MLSMRINRTSGPATPVSGIGREKTVAYVANTEPAPVAARAQAPAPTTSVAMLLALASVDNPLTSRKKLITQGEEALSHLEQLHIRLMTGQTASAELDALARWLEDIETPTDAQLAAIMREIETRVRVELAKQDRPA